MKENTLIIVPNSIKEEVILDVTSKNLINVKYISLEELKKKILFDYDSKAIYYLMDKYHYKYEVAKVYLDNMMYIDSDLKKEIIDNNLNIISLYDDYKNRNIVVIGYDLSDFDYKFLNKLSDKIEVIKDKSKYKHDTIYEFESINYEVEFVFNKISNLINDGVDINDIKVIMNKDYYNIFNRYSLFYNIPISINNESNLYETIIGNYFINNLSNNIIDELKSKFKDIDIINQIINICNRYVWTSLDKVKDLLIYDLKHTKLIKKEYKNSVKQISFDSKVNENDYVFILGFNYGVIPSIYKDEDYLSDNKKKEIGLFTSLEKNKLEKLKIINKINSIKNLTITYKLKNNTEKYIISNLNDSLNLNIVRCNKEFNHSNLYNKLLLSSYLDKLVKYGIKDENLNLLFSNYQDINYRCFNNKYTKIDKEDLKLYIKNNITLSYSSLDNYFKCGFKYYLNNLLRVNPFKETFSTILGSLYHYILEHAFNDDFDFDKCFNEFMDKQTYEFNNKEMFFINKSKQELPFIIDTIKKQYKDTNLNKALYENEYKIDKSKDITVNFIGFIDKILYNDKNVMAIIDYKTGNPNLNIDNAKYGLDLQLPIYLYLTKDLKMDVAGFYLQKILNNEINKDYKKSYLELKENNLKLQGYTNSNLDILEQFDKNYENSNIVKSLKTTAKGFSYYSKMITTDEINDLIKLVDKKIDEAIDNILDCNFDINPKKINNKNVSCLFCEFRDICYKTEKDILELGGDDDA